MVIDLVLFTVSIYLVIHGSTMATRSAGMLASTFKLSKYTVGFIVVAVISILPETFISINSALQGVSSFGLGVLFGSNVADLTLIFAIIVIFAGRSLKVESRLLNREAAYPFILLLPIILGLDGYFSRLEGVALIIVGAAFYYAALRSGSGGSSEAFDRKGQFTSMAKLIASMAVLLLGSYFVVSSATNIATVLGISPILIGMLIVGLGTTIPELFFSVRSLQRNDDSLAVGDLLGTVLADATIVIGIVALIQPFSFPTRLIFVTGGFMVVAAFTLFNFMRSGRAVTRREALMLFGYWVVFILTEFVMSAKM